LASASSTTATKTSVPRKKSLTASPSSVGFGSVQVGSSETQSETLTNSTNSSVTISQATITGAGFSLNGLKLPLTLTAGQSYTFRTAFSPKSRGSVTGSIAILSNAPNSNLTLSRVYRGSKSGGPYTKLNSVLDASTTYTDSSVQSAQTYYYVTTICQAARLAPRAPAIEQATG